MRLEPGSRHELDVCLVLAAVSLLSVFAKLAIALHLLGGIP